MSARDAFLEAYNDPARCLCGGDSPDGACESVEGLLDALLAAHAHELTERQRGFAEQEDAHLRSTSATVYVQGIRDAADLIDPEVSK